MKLHLPLARAAAQRDERRRHDPKLLDTLLADYRTCILVIYHGLTPITAPRNLIYGTCNDLKKFGVTGLPVYLGSHEGQDYVGLIIDDGPGTCGEDGHPQMDVFDWYSLRAVGGELDDLDAGLFTELAALEEWHRASTYCPSCGTATQVTQAGWARHCPKEDRDLFPRTDPAVIMAVLDPADRLLLVHAVAWEGQRHSLVAGFVEAGESLEACVRREVLEETGLEVGPVRYVGSQPWPFPRSLMCAFVARALSTDINVDGIEIECGHWYSREDLKASLADKTLTLPPGASIARAVINTWRQGQLAPPEES
ncbi:MAG: NAD(+) diphosphatase [Bifidobacteriaceae bacterium]|jgi:NAD+ diphosphatase|nr:NAD(+) diphosphatase [Bifidobacteriaceae bacterium]